MVLVIRQYQRRKNSQKKLVNPAIKLELKKAVNPAIKLELKKGRLECKALIFFYKFQKNTCKHMYVCDIMQKMYKELVGMIKNLQIIRVNTNYCDYLRKFDPRVAYNMNEKEIRPFVGILFKIEDCEYFAPLSSPKPKHKKMKNTIDFLKIKNGELGAVNFNNMIPVKSDYYSIIDLNQSTLTLNEAKYQKLLKEQLAWLNANYIQVKDKSYKLYTLYNKGKLPETMRERCCNFKLLEEKCLKYTIIDRSLHG